MSQAEENAAGLPGEEKFLELQLQEASIRESESAGSAARSAPAAVGGRRTPPPAYQDLHDCSICHQTQAASKPLPCGHTYCLPCLTAYFKTSQKIAEEKEEKIPMHRGGYRPDILIGTTVNMIEGKDGAVNNVVKFCDTCTHRGTHFVSAVSHCVDCDTNYCPKHRQSHDDVMLSHSSQPIDNVQSQPKWQEQLQQRGTCHRHEGQVAVMGCRSCSDVLCAKCIDEDVSCKVSGSSHQKMASLDALVSDINDNLGSVKSEMQDKMDRLVVLSNKSSGVLDQYDSDTADMVQLIHGTRDEQINAIATNYKRLETKVIEVRGDLRRKIAEFREMSVESLRASLTSTLGRVKTAASDNHQVELINGFKDAKSLLNTMRDGGLPTLRLNNVVKVIKGDAKGECRNIEVRLTATNNILIAEDSKIRYLCPHSLIKLKTIDLSHYSGAVCSYKGYIYVGLDCRGIGRIDPDGNLQHDFITVLDFIDSIIVYEDMIYALIWQKKFILNAYDINGTLIASCDHPDRPVNNAKNKMAIVNGEIVIPIRKSKVLAVYSLYGKLVRHISCPLLDLCSTSICTLDTDMVIISTYQTDTVFCMNLSTTQIVWKCSQVVRPRAVACYGKGFILVSTDTVPSREMIHVINANTGEYRGYITENPRSVETSPLSPLSSPVSVFERHFSRGNSLSLNLERRANPEGMVIEHSTLVLDMEVTDDTLLVSRARDQALVMYELC